MLKPRAIGKTTLIFLKRAKATTITLFLLQFLFIAVDKRSLTKHVGFKFEDALDHYSSEFMESFRVLRALRTTLHNLTHLLK